MKCLFRLYSSCRPAEFVKKIEFGSNEWLMTICSLCIKSTYAQSHKKTKTPKPSKFSIVNTL